MEFAGTVYICPYCRVQRTVILLLGVAMVLPFTHHWIVRYYRFSGRLFGCSGRRKSKLHGLGENLKGHLCF